MMAKSDLEMKVSVEAAINDTVQETLQSIVDKYGVQIDSIRIAWRDDSTLGERKHTVTAVMMETIKRYS